MKQLVLFLGAIALFVGIVRGQVVTVDNGVTTAVGTTTRGARPAGDTTQVVDISIIPSVGGPQHAASFAAYAGNAVQALRTTGTLPVGVVGSPTEARKIEFLRAEDLMTTATAPFYGGVFGPAAPFNNERGSTVWWWVVVSSRTGGDTVSMDMISGLADSSDPQRSLRKETSLASGAYSPIAIGIRADGSVINSGASSQKARTIIVGIGSKSYLVSDQASLQAVRIHVVGNFSTTMTITAGASTASKTLNLVSPRPMLVAKLVSGIPTFELVDNGSRDSYPVQLSDTLTGPWTDHPTLLRAGDRLQPTGDIKFLRYKP
jgi:hypothetical protein